MGTKKKGAHGGRRHGLAPSGKGTKLLVTLAPEDRAALERLAAERTAISDHPVTLAEVIRLLIREALR